MLNVEELKICFSIVSLLNKNCKKKEKSYLSILISFFSVFILSFLFTIDWLIN